MEETKEKFMTHTLARRAASALACAAASLNFVTSSLTDGDSAILCCKILWFAWWRRDLIVDAMDAEEPVEGEKAVTVLWPTLANAASDNVVKWLNFMVNSFLFYFLKNTKSVFFCGDLRKFDFYEPNGERHSRLFCVGGRSDDCQSVNVFCFWLQIV